MTCPTVETVRGEGNHIAQASRRSRREHPRRVGIYLTAEIILRNPDYVNALRDRLGLNLVIIGFSGQLSKAMLAMSPFDGVPLSDACLHSLVGTHLDGQPVDTTEFELVRRSVGPSVRTGGDDAGFREAIQRVHDVGLEVWIGGGSWTERRLMLCPSQEPVNRWYEALNIYWATQYGIEGVNITHARYPMGSFPRGIGSCVCQECTRTAAEMGYDMDEMKAALHGTLERLRNMDARLLATACQQGLGLFDFIQMGRMSPGVLDWFRFRAAVVGRNLRRFRRAVRAAAGPGVVFGTDTHPVSLSIFVGHNHAEWATFSDFASPLVSHVPAFVVNTVVEWARIIQRVNPGLSETDALRLVYRFLGYDGLGLPKTIGGYCLEDQARMFRRIPLEDLVMHDLIKARLSLPQSIPSYPVIHGEGWPRKSILGIMAGADEAGHDGIILQGTGELVSYKLR
jgi:hypothetical protein